MTPKKLTLDEIFHSPKLGYRGLSGLIKVAKEYGFTAEEIRDYYHRQAINQMFDKKEIVTNIPYSNKHPGRIQIDLVDISLFSSQNDRMKWIMTGIDVQTRIGFAFPMRNKKPESVLPHLKKINKVIPINTLTADLGSEFLGVVKKWLDREGIETWTSSVYKGRTNLVEGFNRIIVSRLFKIMKDTGSYRWIDILDEVVSGYNMNKSKDKPFENDREFIDPFSVGDYVRIRVPRGTFTKEARNQKYSDEIFRIIGRDRARYILINSEYSVQPINYLPRQMKLVDNGSELWKGETIKEHIEASKIVKKVRAKKQFVKSQRDSGLDIDEEGKIKLYRNVVPKNSKRKSTSKYSRR